MTNLGKIVVIGDVLLDEYDYCNRRPNPEGDPPCFTILRKEFKPGGAGNVAANLKSLDDDVVLVSVVGTDEKAGILRDVLSKAGLESHLIGDGRRPTIVKQRIYSNNGTVYEFRLDDEKEIYIDLNHSSEIIKFISERGFDMAVISDYGKGAISPELMVEMKKLGIPIMAGPKPKHRNFYRDVSMISLNEEEAMEMADVSYGIMAAELLREILKTEVMLTRGAEGIDYFALDGKIHSIPAEPVKKKVDVTGAGDSAFAAFCHFKRKNYSIENCVRLANKAGAISVQHPGCYAVSERELLD